MTEFPRQPDKGPHLYRITVEGALDPAWADWLEAQHVEPLPDRTRLEVAVTDQASLHGILRRIHDLHLTVLQLERADLDDDKEGE